jgi:hypothetical protein
MAIPKNHEPVSKRSRGSSVQTIKPAQAGEKVQFTNGNKLLERISMDAFTSVKIPRQVSNNFDNVAVNSALSQQNQQATVFYDRRQQQIR